MFSGDSLTIRLVWYGLFTVSILLQIPIIYIIASRTSTDTTGFDYTSAEYSSYKNSRFKTCVARQPSEAANVNCTQIFAEGGQFVLSGRSTGIYNDYPQTSYCDMLSCFKNYVVIPSTPQPMAFGLSSITIWLYWNITALGTVWSIRHACLRSKGLDGCDRNCNGAGFTDWFFYIFDLACFIF